MAEKKWTTKLNSGHTIPSFGLGTWLSEKGKVGAAVDVAVRHGYRHIDCAHIYGNEAEVGEALQKLFTEGVVKREDLFITSKLWNTEHSQADVVPACQLTLKNLQLDYVDLYLIHWPQALPKGVAFADFTDEHYLGYNEETIADTWKGMEECVAKGLAKSIGISNFTIKKTENLLKTAKIVPAVNQVESHPYLQQTKLKEYLDSKGIAFEAYSPLGTPARPVKGEGDANLMDDAVIKEIATKHECTPAQVLISFALHRGVIVIPKSVTPERVRSNYDAQKITLDDEDMKKIYALEQNLRYLRFFMMKKDQTVEEFWDMEYDKNYVVDAPDAKRSKTADE